MKYTPGSKVHNKPGLSPFSRRQIPPSPKPDVVHGVAESKMVNIYFFLKVLHTKSDLVLPLFGLGVTCPWCLGLMKQLWATLAHEAEVYFASRCEYVDVSSVGCIIKGSKNAIAIITITVSLIKVK